MALKNDSGFHGYAMADLYPGMATGVTQTLETVPEPEEQSTYTQIDTPAPPAVDDGKKMNIWLLVGLVAALIFAFGRG